VRGEAVVAVSRIIRVEVGAILRQEWLILLLLSLGVVCPTILVSLQNSLVLALD